MWYNAESMEFLVRIKFTSNWYGETRLLINTPRWSAQTNYCLLLWKENAPLLTAVVESTKVTRLKYFKLSCKNVFVIAIISLNLLKSNYLKLNLLISCYRKYQGLESEHAYFNTDSLESNIVVIPGYTYPNDLYYKELWNFYIIKVIRFVEKCPRSLSPCPSFLFYINQLPRNIGKLLINIWPKSMRQFSQI